MLIELIWFLAIGAVAGWLSGQIVRGRGFGLAVDIIVGVLGALLGGFLFNLVGLAAYGPMARLIMAVVGAIILLFLIKLIRKA